MSSPPHVVDVDAATFEAEVVAESRRRPVLVDFWAAWCGPCRMLGPVLERVAADLDGALRVAKVDTEANPELARRFAIRGIPACKLFVGGAQVDEIVGALPESAVRDFVGRHIKSELDVELARIASLRDAGDLEPASAAINAVLADHADHPGALVEAARVALARGEADLAAERAAAVSITADEHDLARALVTAAELSRAAIGGDDPYTTGARQATAGQWRDALDTFLDLARTDPRARDAMLAVFVLCEDDELARTYRRKLAIVT